jgi:hypothetical protein
MISQLIFMVAAHFIGDFPGQSVWMAEYKGKSWEILAYHCLVYVSVFALLGYVWPVLLVLLVTHFVIDAAKARYSLIPYIWLDQALHIWVIMIIWWRW